MTTFAADDFAEIARRMRGLRDDDPAGLDYAGCEDGFECAKCEDGGWVPVYSQHPPAFDICPKCFNPKGHPSP